MPQRSKRPAECALADEIYFAHARLAAQAGRRAKIYETLARQYSGSMKCPLTTPSGRTLRLLCRSRTITLPASFIFDIGSHFRHFSYMSARIAAEVAAWAGRYCFHNTRPIEDTLGE